jgi:membrane-bound lytic murein transglycosylase B
MLKPAQPTATTSPLAKPFVYAQRLLSNRLLTKGLLNSSVMAGLLLLSSQSLIHAQQVPPSADAAADAATDATEQDNDAAFVAWLADFRVAALERGIRADTLDLILPTISQERQVVQADRNQAEFVNTYANYLQRVNSSRIEAGKRLMQTHGDMIRQVSAEYGVQHRFVVAIMGLESNYGAFPITQPLFSVIATLAYDGRRGEMFRNELFAALEIVDRGLATPDMMKSSWAGALGIIQFTPSSFLRLAVDHDKDGRIDLWSMGPDVIASVANYLRSHGWQQDQTWGRVVSLPPGGEQSLQAPQEAGLTPDAACQSFTTTGAWRSLNDWQELGVRRTNGSVLPTRNLQAALIVGDEGDDKGYLVYRNFCSIMRYNPAFRYALSVGLLADAIDDIRD